jgi:aspartate racemase
MSTVMPPIATDELARDVYVFPTSLAQQRIWFYSKFAPDNPFYNIPLRFRLKGLLDLAILEKSLNEIVARHEVLRTAIASVDGHPRQVVSANAKLTLVIKDLSKVDQAENELQRLATVEAQEPFDLAQGPLFRCTLVRLGEAEHELLLTMHHVIADGWAVGVFVRELTELYSAQVKGTEPRLSDLPVQYADYAVWQREWADGEECKGQLEYWKRQLDGLTSLQLLTDHPRPVERSFAGGGQSLALSPELSEALRAFSEEQGVTLFMTLLAAFQTLLYRYTEQQDIAIGSPIANRNREEIEGLIGFFANSVVLRAQVTGELTFIELLQQVREVTLGAYAHQDLPFDKLVAELQPERATNRNPLFQVVFALQNAPVDELDLAGVKLSSPSSAGRSDIFDSLALLAATRFDLELHLWDQPDGICGGFLYSTELFDQATVRRLSEHFRNILAAVVSDPSQRLSDVPLLTAAERKQLLVGFNQTDTAYPNTGSIQSLFELQARKTPMAVAIVNGDAWLTYQELNEHANKLAHYLRRCGVGRNGHEALVGIMLKRSIDMIVAILAVLKAGGAYVPLDPSYPKERLRFMIEDTEVDTLVSGDGFLETLPESSAQVISLDRDADKIGRERKENPTATVTADHLAYVMYTSGSTGRPKGICVEHRAVVRLVKNTNYVELNDNTVMLQFAPVSFDASTLEIWGPLLNGGRLVVFSPENPSLTELGGEIKKRGINTMWLTAGLFHLLVDERLDDLRGVKQLLAGGDVLSVNHVTRFLNEMPGCQLVNGYGPTENTTFTCCHVMTSTSDVGATVPIGKPISNTHVYLLDQKLQPVPIGIRGELFAGGDGVARAYLKREELTSERFLADPFNDKPGARMYRTGDLARYRDNGDIEFLGRKDNQVKIRGFRVELGEIEAAIKEHPLATDCAVVVREDQPGEKRLVAYVVPAKGVSATSETIKDLRSGLRHRLPDYLVPALFVLLSELPLSSNGKVDRNRLPVPDVHSDLESVYVAPQTEVERAIADIWQATLGIQKVSRNDNFFELGGDSLDATRVHTKLSNSLNRELTITDLFQYPTVRSLARYIGQKSDGETTLNKVRERAHSQKQVLNQRAQALRERRRSND